LKSSFSHIPEIFGGAKKLQEALYADADGLRGMPQMRNIAFEKA